MKIVVFTGAGVSRESGLKTFRDSEDGLWEGYDIMAVASPKGWWKDPQQVLDFYNFRRREVRNAAPNDAHIGIAELELHHDVTVITQNIDDLHERAGSTRVIHLHGEVLKVRPDRPDSEPIPWIEDLNLGDQASDGAQLRPHIVWFGEEVPKMGEALEVALADDVDLLIVVGTSLNVYPAAMIATESRARRIVLIDPHPPDVMGQRVQTIAATATIGVRGLVRQLLDV